MIEDYIIKCIRQGKKPAARKISGHTIDYKILYCKAYNISPTVCTECTNESVFISMSKGFGKYCSKRCYSKALSNRNTQNNAQYNKKLSSLRRQENDKKYSAYVREFSEEYLTTDITIPELSKKYNIDINYIRKHLRDNGLTRRDKALTKRKKNLLEVHGFQDINETLRDRTWVDKKISGGWTCRNFSLHLGCSPNYVSRFLKKAHPDLEFSNNSSYESEVVDFLKSQGIKYELHNRKIIPPKEIDIYLPDFKVGIEINGVYWHSFEKVGKYYHKEKTDLALGSGIRLIHFTDREIENKFDQVKSIILAATNLCRKIHARKCEISEIDTEIYRSFCDQNHIQGYSHASIKQGLFFDDQLVAVMGFAKPRFTKKIDYEIIRYCCLLGTTVVGGPSKLFSNFAKENKPKSIISYAQRRIFNGNMYSSMGMQHIRNTPPGYIWVNKNNHILTRYQTQKHKLNFLGQLKEKEIMANSGYYQVYDCGQKVFIWYDK